MPTRPQWVSEWVIGVEWSGVDAIRPRKSTQNYACEAGQRLQPNMRQKSRRNYANEASRRQVPQTCQESKQNYASRSRPKAGAPAGLEK